MQRTFSSGRNGSERRDMEQTVGAPPAAEVGESHKELSGKRPLVQFTTSDAECAKSAADKAMVKVHELEAGGGKKK